MLRIDLILIFSLDFCFFAYCMKKYSIEVTEVLCRVVEVEAIDDVEAIEIAKMMYQNSDTVLDASDYVLTEFSVIDELSR